MRTAMAPKNFWKLSVLEVLKNGEEMGFVVKMTAIPTRKDAVLLADTFAKDGLIVRVSKHINQKRKYYYGK